MRDYKVCSRNSTVRGYPGRDFDWSKFDWDGKTTHQCDLCGVQQSPEPWVDDGFIGPNSQYLHVPYDYAEQCTIFRVRPNKSMQAGSTWHGHKIVKQAAIKKDDGWYWRLYFEGEV